MPLFVSVKFSHSTLNSSSKENNHNSVETFGCVSSFCCHVERRQQVGFSCNSDLLTVLLGPHNVSADVDGDESADVDIAEKRLPRCSGDAELDHDLI